MTAAGLAPSAEFQAAAISAVGAAHAAFTEDELRPYLATTGPRRRQAAGVIRPGSTEEVAAIVRAAARHRVPLYPISTGRNWGDGDAMPVAPDQVILDLGRMNRIHVIDEKLAYAVIEPGVTQGMLYEHIRSRGLKLWTDSTGAGPDAGIIGNIMERGFGHTPYGDRVQAVSGLEVVLGDGEILHTGFARDPQSPMGPLYPYGVGPMLDGLFSQSSLGVVTRMGLWLMPAPDYFAAAIVTLDDPAAIAPLIDRLQPLRLEGTLQSVVHIANDYRLLSGHMTYPYERTGGRTPLPPDLRVALRRERDVPAWALSAGFYGGRGAVSARIKRLKAALSGLPVKLMVVDDRKLALGRRVAQGLGRLGLGRELSGRVADGEAAIGLLKGIPNRHFLKGAYWRMRSAPGDKPDPAADGAGLLWLGPVLPQTGDHVARFLALVEPLFMAHGFECLLTFSMVNGRSLAAVLTIAFDRNDRAQCDAAEACYRDLARAVTQAGYPPYRGHSHYMNAVTGGESSYWRVVGRLKDALDPAGIIAPGRYNPGS